MALGNLIRGEEGTLKRDPVTGHLRFKGVTASSPFLNIMQRSGTFTGPIRYTLNDAANDRDVVQQGAVDALSAWTTSSVYVEAYAHIRITSAYASGGLVGGIELPGTWHYRASAECRYRSAVLSPSEGPYMQIIGVSFTVTDYQKLEPTPTYYVSVTAVTTSPTDRGTTFAWAIGTYNTQITGNGVYEVRNRSVIPQYIPGTFPPQIFSTQYGWGYPGTSYLVLCAFIDDLTVPVAPEESPLHGSVAVNINKFRVSSPSLIYKD